MDCSTKSRIREIALPGMRAPQPLRSERRPRGLPTLSPEQAQRVETGNEASDFQLAVQHVMDPHGRGAFRENPRRSLHWKDPPTPRCAHWHSELGWSGLVVSS